MLRRLSALAITTVLSLNMLLIGCATTQGMHRAAYTVEETPDNSRLYRGSVVQMRESALQVLKDYSITIKDVQSTNNTVVIVGMKGSFKRSFFWIFLTGYFSFIFGSYGEMVAISINQIEPGISSVKVISKKRLATNILFVKDWTTDILDGVSASFSYATAKDQKSYQIYEMSEDWLNSIRLSLEEALFDKGNTATLAVECQGRHGGYISSKIATYLSSSSELQMVSATGAELQAILQQQDLHMFGIFDENTAVEAGKIIGAKYLLVCSPYIKNEAGQVELHCKLVDVETGQFTSGGIIVFFPLSDLPS